MLQLRLFDVHDASVQHDGACSSGGWWKARACHTHVCTTTPGVCALRPTHLLLPPQLIALRQQVLTLALLCAVHLLQVRECCVWRACNGALVSMCVYPGTVTTCTKQCTGVWWHSGELLRVCLGGGEEHAPSQSLVYHSSHRCKVIVGPTGILGLDNAL